MNTLGRTVTGKFLLVVCLALVGINVSQAQVIDPVEGKAMVARGALLVDVRTAKEFDAGHVEGAINIPHLDVGKMLSEFGDDLDREIVLYCRSGNRSGLAQEDLRALGYTRVFNAGSYEDWVSTGDQKCVDC